MDPSESRRLAALRRYDILDTPPDGAFDRITAMASRLLGTPVAIVSLVDEDRIWFKSHHGLDVEQIDREPGLCASAVMGTDAYVLTDASIDPRSLANPLVAGQFGLRFYAGVPLRTREGHNLGVLCCVDFRPRDVSEQEMAHLRDLAAIVMDEIELRRAAREVDDLNASLRRVQKQLAYQARHDELTGFKNRSAISRELTQALSQAREESAPLAVLMIDVDHFKRVNDTYGHLAGDAVLVTVTQRLRAALRDADMAGRVGGEEFMVVLRNCTAEQARVVAERLRRAVCEKRMEVQVDDHRVELNVSISVGISAIRPRELANCGLEDAVKAADAALYEAKSGGRNRVVLACATRGQAIPAAQGG